MKVRLGYGHYFNNMQIKTIVIFVAVTLGVLLGVGAMLSQYGASDAKQIVDIAGEERHSKGSGPVTIVEFSDFQCPACLAVQAPLSQLLNKYSDKVKFVYRYFPLTQIHKNAQLSAQAAEAAGLQGKFFEMHDKLFTMQASWEGITDPHETFAGYAEAIGIDKTKFLSDLDSQVVKDSVQADASVASKYNLSGTPTFFVNGVKTEFPQLESKILELSK